ncbi:hypothetical protein HMPREF0576_1311 [Mobiluncus holmesii ATCC 35242]|uniref:Uncharacterized protein n=1 Tax=Mobiluncus holmesii ATCC 35242 TaxID=887899 RepID=E6M4S1_9ACTO|nr:hypothetical protein HMPREF0576_1311 [Mobiluncus holmesii ATCC 35242]
MVIDAFLRNRIENPSKNFGTVLEVPMTPALSSTWSYHWGYFWSPLWHLA